MGILNQITIKKEEATRDRIGQDMPQIGKWTPVDKGYHGLITRAAAKYGVPADLAIRQAAQESAFFSQDVISGKVKSGAGAIGLFQFMPPTAKALGVNPTDPASAADGAMRYMARLYKMFGDWKKAAWAYNWGEGNLRKFLKGEKSLPKETRLYGLIVADGWTPSAAKASAAGVK